LTETTVVKTCDLLLVQNHYCTNIEVQVNAGPTAGKNDHNAHCCYRCHGITIP